VGDRVSRSDYPWWVKFSMWGVPGRTGLWVYAVVCIAIAGACVPYGFWDRRSFLVTISALLASLMYWLSIQWVDRHGSWGEKA